MEHEQSKTEIRRHLRQVIAGLSDAQRHAKSVAACAFVTGSPQFQAARTVMLFLSTPLEVDTAPLALRAWQHGKTVVVPKVSWDARRMVPTEITSLSSDQLHTMSYGVREPIAGLPVPVSDIDLVLVPGMGFTEDGHRIGRGMGFYDRFLVQGDFLGVSCGLAFEEQIVARVPMLDHDAPLSMLATDRGIRHVTAPKMVKAQ
ncbi:MAG TPA: 5-formyltetrahydrofolate cyclo-ligase [Tepidisphaeraceae bacterium]|jgi:5-formyltetrahydrofolate cyclo-ligase